MLTVRKTVLLRDTPVSELGKVAARPVVRAVALHAFSFFSGQALGVILMGFGLHSVGLTGATAIAALIVMGVGLVASYVLTRPAALRARSGATPWSGSHRFFGSSPVCQNTSMGMPPRGYQ